MNRFFAAAVVFCSSAVVLVLEVTVIRLVAPYAGDTLETYTAAIGVTLAAIALGARLGGAAADRRPHRPLLAVLLLLGGGTTLLARPVVLLLGPLCAGAGPFTALLLVGCGIAVPVALLSAVPPVVVKTQLADAARSGSVVGRLSAWGTAGALAGTVLTGYVLVALFPVSTILLLSGGATVAGGLLFAVRGALFSRTGRPRNVLVLLGICLISGTLLVSVPSPCTAETAYYCARVTADPHRPHGRVLYLDDLRHSYVDLADPTHLEFGYTQWFGAAVDTQLPAGPVDSLHVGGGASTMPRWLAAVRPGSTSLVLEIDPAVAELARTELGLRTGADLAVVTGDARTSIVALPSRSYDLVLGDAFSGLSVPWHLTTLEFAEQVHRVLRPSGWYAVNVIDQGDRDFLAAQAATLSQVFSHLVLIVEHGTWGSPAGGNHVLLASDTPFDTDALAAALAGTPVPGSLVAPGHLARLSSRGPVLTDDYAPVDQLLTPYL